MKHDISLAVRRFIGENFLFRDDGDAITHDASLLDAGIIDSTGILELVSFLEDRYAVRVEDDELVPENLDSVNNVLRFLESTYRAAAELARWDPALDCAVGVPRRPRPVG